MKRIAVLDGSVNGQDGNTSRVTDELLVLLPQDITIDRIELRAVEHADTIKNRLSMADGFIFATGTYWQSWGSPMQRFLEQSTDWEGTDLWLGKPVCCVVTMHSLGGMEVLARLQANLALMGAVIPPMCSIVYSHVNQLALQHPDANQSHDIWGLDSLPTVAHNLMTALERRQDYRTWTMDRDDAVTGIWFKK